MMVHGFEKISLDTINALLEDDGVHAVLFISFAIGGSATYRAVVDLIQEKRTKPVFFSLLGKKKDVEDCRQLLEENRIPFYLFPEMGIRVLAHMWRYARARDARTTSPLT
jgi:acyl-CoA synthetase (NDP forming)